ncbi:MAG: tetratricopeptide repeat protein [Opitutae bacterium]|nr:tetratricopeptide repeat protein [Opitutae bacterium]
MKLIPAALAAFALALSAHAAADPTALNAAVELFNQRKQPEALKAFEALAATDPKNADVQFYLGRLALQRRDFEKAVAFLEKAAELSPADARYHQRLGDAYGQSAEKAGMLSKMGLAKKCRLAYEKAVELDPKSIDARSSLMSYYQQAPGIAGGGLDKALAQAQEIQKLDAARGRFALAGVYAADKKYDQAFAVYEEVLKAKPDDYAALFQTGRLAAISGERMDHGLKVLRQCLTLTPPENQPPHAAAHWRIGFILEKKGDKAGARAAYEASLKLDPKFSQAIESLKKL